MLTGPRDLLAAHDPGYGALRRALRSAILMPGAFALCLEGIGNPVMAPFAAFGAISTLLLVDFRGTLADRARSQAALVAAGAGLVCLGTLCSHVTAIAVAAMFVLAVVISFAGVVSSVFAGATTSLLLAFILPVSLPGPASQIPERLAGWSIAGGLSVLGVCLLWPAPASDPLRGPVLRAVRALAACLRGEPDDESGPELHARAREALGTLAKVFLATPYRPTGGLTTGARAGVRLVDELRWLGRIVLHEGRSPGQVPETPPPARAVCRAAAEVLERGAEILSGEAGRARSASRSDRRELTRARETLAAVAGALAEQVSIPHAARVRGCDKPATMERAVSQFGGSLDPAFRAQETSFMVSQIASNIELIAAANRRSWSQRLLGRQPPGIGGPLSSVRERARAHLAPGSVSARNALRAGIALAISVLASRLLGVEHAFWVSFGTLSILRSNALSTGQTFVRAIGGTVLGFLVGAGLVLAIGTNTTVLWVLLPFAVLIGGIAPAAISFTAGQAAFTVVLFILFNILAPAGWQIGLVRIEDVALGGAASLVVGFVFWPRGAASALRRALADAYRASTAYLTGGIGHAVACCAPGMPGGSTQLPEAVAAAAASRRLDDAFRTYLAERGPKGLALGQVSPIVAGPVVLRLAGDAILELWSGSEEPSRSRFVASRELLAESGRIEQWYGRFSAVLDGAGELPDPQRPDDDGGQRLLAAIDDDLRSADGVATATAVRILWTGDHLDAARRLEAEIVAADDGDELSQLGAVDTAAAWLSRRRPWPDGARPARRGASGGSPVVPEPLASAAPVRASGRRPPGPESDDPGRRAPHT